MSAVAIEACCGSIGADPRELKQCPTCFKIWRGDKRLISVGRIVAMFPQAPCSSCHWPIYSDHQAGCPVKVSIDNANVRGKQVDALFSKWVTGKLDKIPAGTRTDSRDLFFKLQHWFNRQPFDNIEAQVLLADDDVGGICDLRIDGMIIDLKTVYSISYAHAIQVGGYCSLGNGKRGALLHISERFDEPKLIPLDMEQICYDFAVCRSMYQLANRHKALPSMEEV